MINETIGEALANLESDVTHFQTKEAWIQVINAIPEFMQLCVQLVQKTPHEVFGNLALFEDGG